MAGLQDDALEAFWNRLPTATLNQCEHLLINGIGKALVGSGIDPLGFDPDEYVQLIITMLGATEEKLKEASNLLCQWLNLNDESIRKYVQAAVPQLRMWTGEIIRSVNIENIFI